MTAENLTFGRKKTTNRAYFVSVLRSYWWLGLIAGIVYLMAGPVAFWMLLSTTEKYNSESERLFEEMQRQVTEWFRLDGMISYYFIAMGLAIILAGVLFAYLHDKRQVNFYHSMPIKRRTLFADHVWIGVLLNFIPMIFAIAVMGVVAKAFGGDVPCVLILRHIGRIFLFFAISYALTILAGQLTGTILTHVGMTGVLYFGAFGIGALFSEAAEMFLGTSMIDWERILHLSPFTELILWIDHQTNQATVGLEMKNIVILLLLTIVLLAAALFLYQKRPSEAASYSLVYPISKPIVRFIVVFCGGFFGAMFFMAIAESKLFFFAGLIIFSILCHMAMEVIIEKDFKAMLGNKKGYLFTLAALLAVSGGFFVDIFQYDAYVPDSQKVQGVYVDFSDLDGYYHYRGNSGWISNNEEQENVYFSSAEDIELLLTLAQEIVADENYDRPFRERDDQIDNRRNAVITYHYKMASGREIARRYSGVNCSKYEKEIAALYERNSYKKVQYSDILKLTGESIQFSNIYTRVGDIHLQETCSIEQINYVGHEQDRDYHKRLLEALKADIINRKADVLYTSPVYMLNMESRDNNAWNDFSLDIYPQDEQMMALLQEIKTDKAHYAEQATLASIDKVYLCNIKDSENGKPGLFSDIIYRYGDIYSLRNEIGEALNIREITEPSEIKAALEQAVLADNWERSIFGDIDQAKFALIKTTVRDSVYRDEQGRETYYYLVYPE